MVNENTSVITIDGIPIEVTDVLSAMRAAPAFRSAVRMKALERTIVEMEAAHAACQGQGDNAPDESEDEAETEPAWDPKAVH